MNLVFLLIFSIFTLTEMKENLTEFDYILSIWIFSYITEEIGQYFRLFMPSWKHRLLHFIKNSWNVLDTIGLVLFVLGILLKIIPKSNCQDCFKGSQVILSLSLAVLYLRQLHMFSISKKFGPKLVMIGLMMKELFWFLVILIFIILGYGIASQSILFPNSKLDFNLIKKIFYKAYFQIHGELFLDDFENQSCNSTISSCPTDIGKEIAPILLAFYILFTNVLMLNLLIAIFR